MSRNTTFDLVSHIPNLTSKIVKKRRLFKKELSLIFIVGFIGCAGTLFVFNKSWFPEKLDTQENYVSITISNNEDINNAIVASDKPFLEVIGNLSTDSHVSFQIKNYNPNAAYEIDFGDGQVHKCGNDLINHKYANQGDFQIEMKMLFRDKETVVYNNKIEISNGKSSLLSSL